MTGATIACWLRSNANGFPLIPHWEGQERNCPKSFWCPFLHQVASPKCWSHSVRQGKKEVRWSQVKRHLHANQREWNSGSENSYHWPRWDHAVPLLMDVSYHVIGRGNPSTAALVICDLSQRQAGLKASLMQDPETTFRLLMMPPRHKM